MLAAVLADNTALVRVKVPAPLFTTNLALLTNKLGGLLNRCVNVLPCRRDMPITAATASTMLSTLQQCIQSKGIVMALPEHRLSFQLKFVEQCRADNTAVATALHSILQLYEQCGRDVLDEIDELLRVKYQLVYTVDGAEPVSGGTQRWTVACAVLACVSRHAAQLAAKHGANAVEYSAASIPGAFPYIRILQEHAGTDLMNMIVDDIVSGSVAGITLPELSTTERTALKHFLLSPEIDTTSLKDSKCLHRKGSS
jgi:Protein of unknown function (DUF3638)